VPPQKISASVFFYTVYLCCPFHGHTTDTGSITTGLSIEALNDVFDIYSKRFSATFRDRIPKGIRLILIFISLVTILLRGYMDGLLGKLRSLFAATILILVFSAILVIIVDLERPPYNDRRL
jgi:hypothetical protein